MTEKIAIIGAGNAGCISAINLHYLNVIEDNDIEIEIYHDLNSPIEKVGQGTQLNIRETVFDVLGINWVSKNTIKATTKQGIRYKGWGKKNDDFFHPFDIHRTDDAESFYESVDESINRFSSDQSWF